MTRVSVPNLTPGARDLLAVQRFAVLATSHHGSPYACLVAFAVSGDGKVIYFATLDSTRKAQAIEANPRVCLLIDDRRHDQQDLFRASTVAIEGNALRLRGTRRVDAVRTYLAAHPQLEAFLSMPGCSLYGVEIEEFHEVARFGESVTRRQPG